METLPVELLIEIILHLSYRDLMVLYQVNRLFHELLQDPIFWRCKIKQDYPNTHIAPGPTRWDYLQCLTESGGCECGSERFLSSHQCLIRAIDQDNHSMIEYFSQSNSRTVQFIQAILRNNLPALHQLSFQGELKLFDVDISHSDLIVLARSAIHHNCSNAVRFLFNYTPTSIESVMPTIILDTVESEIRDYLLDLQRQRDGFLGWAYINQFKRPPILLY